MIGGTIASAIQANKARKMLKAQKAENQAWYEREYNQDPTKRADIRMMLDRVSEDVRNRDRGAVARKNLIGGTEEVVNAEKSANNKALSDTISNVVAANEARKDAVQNQYQARKAQLEGMEYQDSMNRASQIGQAVQGIGGAASAIASNMGDERLKKGGE